MEARDHDGYIVRKGNIYLKGVVLYMAGEKRTVKWTASRYDAWFTKDIGAAVEVAKILESRVVRFNRITGKEVEPEWNKEKMEA